MRDPQIKIVRDLKTNKERSRQCIVGNIIWRARKTKGLTQSELGCILRERYPIFEGKKDYTIGTYIGYIERGVMMFDHEVLTVLEEILDLNKESLTLDNTNVYIREEKEYKPHSASVYIFGSRRLTYLSQTILENLDSIMDHKYTILLDSNEHYSFLVQEYLLSCNYRNVLLYYGFRLPRYNIGRWDMMSCSEPLDKPLWKTLITDSTYGLVVKKIQNVDCNHHRDEFYRQNKFHKVIVEREEK